MGGCLLLLLTLWLLPVPLSSAALPPAHLAAAARVPLNQRPRPVGGRLGYSSAAGIQQQCWDTVALFSAATRCPGTIMHLAAARATISLHASPRRVSSSGAHSPAQPSFFLLLPTLTGVPHLAPQQIGERCSQLRALDCTVARRAGGLLLMGEEPDQLGFRALFTIAANCPLLEVRARCWCGAGGPLMRPRVPACQADACDAVHGWWDPAAALV